MITMIVYVASQYYLSLPARTWNTPNESIPLPQLNSVPPCSSQPIPMPRSRNRCRNKDGYVDSHRFVLFYCSSRLRWRKVTVS
jgi:hypothetical protein